MPIVSLKCPSCGGEIQLDDSKDFGFCMHCGNKIMTFENVKQTIRYDNSHLVDNWLALGESALKSDDAKRVESYADKVIEVDANNSFAWLLKGCSAFLLGRYSESGHSWKRAFEAVEDKKTAIRYYDLTAATFIQVLPTIFPLIIEESLTPEKKHQFEKAWECWDIICPKFKLNPAVLTDEFIRLLYEKCDVYAEDESYPLYLFYFADVLTSNSYSDFSCIGAIKRSEEANVTLRQMIDKHPLSSDFKLLIYPYINLTYHLNDIFSRQFSSISEDRDRSIQDYWYAHLEERGVLEGQIEEAAEAFIENDQKILFGKARKKKVLEDIERFAVRMKTIK